ncbi:hypothetical protein QQS21_007766 [Conoideocrella luteorostrata]|uniref:CRIB domain-containing protein n=1 Tax=Conoideocrella luteorostrata TaxID=1105319 RepID=A0AAJ0CMZ3_9HYPO|nr:hypothetical protein QQS21_007766 [Conoideocrella luteorostrata]
MFGIGAVSLYAGCHDAVPTTVSKKNPKTARPSTSSSSQYHAPSGSPSDSTSMEQLSSASIADFLGPALNSPPSPRKLRQLSKEMKRASHLQTHHGHKTASSESLSISSINTPEHLPWEISLDNLSLVRKSSIRSIDSSTPSRDRPESVHNFGKGFFHRRGKSKRESSAHSSAASSLYSGEVNTESSSVGGKEGIIPSIFSRRKLSRDETAQKRPQISGPFNFQHVTHTHREDVSDDVSIMRPSDLATGISTIGSEEAQCGLPCSLSLESMGGMNNEQPSSRSSRPPLVPRHTAPALGPRRLLKHIRSQDQLRKNLSQPPPRPPRSPAHSNDYPSFSPPPPPPRTSSRQSNYYDIVDTVDSATLTNSHTLNELRQQLPLGPNVSNESVSDDFTSYELDIPTQQEHPSPDENRYSRALLAARDSAWPLTMSTPLMYEAALPDVPEEEEHHGTLRKSRLSLASNNSSLRGSQSVPMLRSLAESQRPTSGASETLGGLCPEGINRIIHTDPQNPTQSGTPTRESWEDLIDYCYEHEAEADCDYQWDRPSLDTARDSTTPPANAPGLDDVGLGLNFNAVSPNNRVFVAPVGPGAPLFGSAIYNSTGKPTEAVTSHSIMPNNFSLPRGDRKSLRTMNSRDIKRTSGLSTFRESQAFTLSPSFLIPGDYQQQMLLHESEKHSYADYEIMARNYLESPIYDDATLSASDSKSSPLTGQRSSTSTTETNSTSRSNSTGRHRSTNSSWTTLTRRTASSTSLNKMAGALTDECEPLPSTHFTDDRREETEWNTVNLTAQDHVPDMIPFPPASGLKRYYHKSHASESQVRDEVSPPSPVESSRPRRPRARTSLSAQSPPPVGQYALFPRTHVKAIGDHI